MRAFSLTILVAKWVDAQDWELLYEEDFSNPLPGTNAQWVLEDYAAPFDTIMEDNGIFYQNDYGPAFLEALNSFDTYRKEISLGTDGWLTVSLSARDWNKDGILEREPNVSIINSNNRRALQLDASEDHTSGVILRNTRPLPDEYRIEYKLMTFDFGGKKQGNIEYDGKINGYKAEGPVYPCKTQHPWGEGSMSPGWEGNANAPYCEWQDVQRGVYGYNGFSFLTIADFPDPAPRNNHFWHYHRKVLIDAFSQHPDRVGDQAGGQVCNAATNEYYDYRDSSYNVVNMWISGLPGSFTPNPGGLTGSSQRFMTTCNGGKATRGIQSAAELQPELMPNEYYTFAIERNSTGYTMEVSGNFVHSGVQTIRFHRPFEVNGEPIWHYNTRADEYDGRHNADLTQQNWAYGSMVWPDQWPLGSEYPDSFVIGDLYTNAYEGTASVTDIKLFRAKPSCERAVLLTSSDIIQSGQRLVHSDSSLILDFQRNANLQLWEGINGNPERLLWESNVNQPTNVTYFTELQVDGNLVTYHEESTTSLRNIVWMTQLAGPIDGTVYSFARDCEENGGKIAIFVGQTQSSQETLWSAAVSTGPPAPEPTVTPLAQEAAPLNGNVEVRWGSPEFPGALLWESGFVGGNPERSYYTKFEANSNLITWEIMPDKSFSQAWELGTYQPILSPYYFVVDCSERNNQVAVYQGDPNDPTSPLIWAVDPPFDSSSMPFPVPTVPPTLSPSSSPTVEGILESPTIREVEVDPDQPTSVSIDAQGAASSRTSVSFFPILTLILVWAISY
ncbi:hypothetical protein IV203_006016 [Nitzschia inconspicua]|uniref:Bulb-type lectin domain-containing protein n=1 Tax=Nitzschia inconspicua TaxID=303405 RepID=A0A9K3PGM1_9STRA|nr:hypothetical protein IV203_006016 [Nitzschia inconspicua]